MTGEPRLVTVTRSPDWTLRTYSLNWFLRARMPTVFMRLNVATGSHIVNWDRLFLVIRARPNVSSQIVISSCGTRVA